MIGTTLNHYTIVEKLGEGGMAEVYLAVDTRLGRKVALKLLPPAVADDEVRRKRFEREVDEVARQRTDYEVTLQTARVVSLQLTRGGFGRLEDFFANSILNADMGVVDVYWAQKLEVADELQRVREEKDDLVADLERRFKLIREKMGDGK